MNDIGSVLIESANQIAASALVVEKNSAKHIYEKFCSKITCRRKEQEREAFFCLVPTLFTANKAVFVVHESIVLAKSSIKGAADILYFNSL